MARTRTTPRKTTAVRPVRIGRTDSFYSFRMGEQQNMVRFLNQFQQRWAAVRGQGVTELDGVLQLVQALPPSWRGWASEAALDFVHPDMEVRVTGNLIGFIDLLKEQFRLSRNPPPGHYPSLDQFIPAVHRILADILAPKEANVDFDIDEPTEDESDPEECSDIEPFENQDADVDRENVIESEMTSIDLELYGQPFALDPPSPPLFPPTPPPEDTSEPPLANVGTSRLQPLPISEMSLATNSFNRIPGEPANSNTGSPSTVGETRLETPEERREADDEDATGN